MRWRSSVDHLRAQAVALQFLTASALWGLVNFSVAATQESDGATVSLLPGMLRRGCTEISDNVKCRHRLAITSGGQSTARRLAPSEKLAGAAPLTPLSKHAPPSRNAATCPRTVWRQLGVATRLFTARTWLSCC